MYDDLVEFLQESVTPFHAAATAESWLAAAGFTALSLWVSKEPSTTSC